MEERCYSLAEPIAGNLGLELFGVKLEREGGHLILRFIIDHVDGVTHQHCEQFSKLIDPLLDEADPIPVAYLLEVSSPGVERPLRHRDDYIRFQGNFALFKVRSNNTTVEIRGYIGATDSESLTLRLVNDTEQRIAFKDIKTANLCIK